MENAIIQGRAISIGDLKTALDKSYSKTKVKTVVPKDPNKPGMIQRDPSGKLIMSNKPGQPQEVDDEIKPGDTVEVGQ